MDIIALIVTILVIWFIIRLLGRIFDGPRYRRRRRRKDYGRAQRYAREDAYIAYEERAFMRTQRRRGRW